jgi:hypothetical protein
MVVTIARQQAKGQHLGTGFGAKVVKNFQQDLQKTLHLAQTELLFNLTRIAPLLKNESFSEEKEWRLVLPSESIMMPTNHPTEFRAIRDGLVPYIAYPLLLPNQEGEVPCNDLILGPGSHPSAEVGVRMFLQTRFIPVQVRTSKVPYRPA